MSAVTGDSSWIPVKVQLQTTFDQTSLSPKVVIDSDTPEGAKTLWLTCSTQQRHGVTSVTGCQVKIRQSRGVGDTWAIIDLGLFSAVCIDVGTSTAVRIEVVANAIASDLNANVTAQFCIADRQQSAKSRAWYVQSYAAGAPVQQVPSQAVKVMSLTAGGDGAFQWSLMDATAVMRAFPQALAQSVPVDVIATHFQSGVAGEGGMLAWLIQL